MHYRRITLFCLIRQVLIVGFSLYWVLCTIAGTAVFGLWWAGRCVSRTLGIDLGYQRVGEHTRGGEEEDWTALHHDETVAREADVEMSGMFEASPRMSAASSTDIEDGAQIETDLGDVEDVAKK